MHRIVEKPNINRLWKINHTSMLVRDFFAKNKAVIMPKPLYSPDLAPAGFFLFPNLKPPMNGKRFATIAEMKENSKLDLSENFRSISMIEKNAGISVVYLRRVTLKGTKQLLINKQNLK